MNATPLGRYDADGQFQGPVIKGRHVSALLRQASNTCCENFVTEKHGIPTDWTYVSAPH